MRERIATIVADMVRRRTGKVVEVEPSDHLFDDLCLDSLDRVEVLMAVEEEYGTGEINEGRVFTVADIEKAVTRLTKDHAHV